MKGNILVTMLPFISGHGRSVRVRGTPFWGWSAPTATSEKRGRHRFGAAGLLARATTCRWASSLGIALHAGLEVLRSGRGDWRGVFASGGAEAQLRAHIYLGGQGAEFSPRCGENSVNVVVVPTGKDVAPQRNRRLGNMLDAMTFAPRYP